MGQSPRKWAIGSALERCRHDDENQIRPNGLPHFPEHRRRHIGVQAPLVKFIEQDRADAFQKRIGQKHPREDPFRDDAQPCSRPNPTLEANLVTHFLAECGAGLFRNACRGGASRHPAGLKHDQIRMLGASSPARRIAGGTRVVFPAPGGATRTSDRCARTVATTSGNDASMGSGVINRQSCSRYPLMAIFSIRNLHLTS